jgi:arsenite methyltransferase
MEAKLSSEEHRKIETGIREKYVQVAVSPGGHFNYPVGRAGLKALGYDPTWTDRLPEHVADSYCGVGNPFSLGEIRPGDNVLDIGCGAGVDTIIAAMMVGSHGRAMGIDLVPEMVRRAEKNRRQMGAGNLRFREADAATLDVGDNSFDVVISNGVFNLIPEKGEALKTIFRMLKPAGRLMLADQIARGPVAKDLKARIGNWFR